MAVTETGLSPMSSISMHNLKKKVNHGFIIIAIFWNPDMGKPDHQPWSSLYRMNNLPTSLMYLEGKKYNL